jgi:uncharacterized protein YbjT (DUF2867 family)
MILVAGGTGRLGRVLVPRLVATGNSVRVLTRDAERARHLGDEVEVVAGDVRDRSTLGAALAGVATVVSAVQGFAGPGRVTPASVDRDGNANLVDAASTAGADVVLMSVVGASADSPMELFRAKYDAEANLRDSGVGWTIVRATAYAELWAELVGKGLVFGRGDNPINFVSVVDVAAVVERAVTDRGLRGTVIEVGGAENLTFNEFAVLLQQVRGEPTTTRHVPRSLLRAMAPFQRQARAAVVMDTLDMTYTHVPDPEDAIRSRPTDLAMALTR